jgi:hypothetical protein
MPSLTDSHSQITHLWPEGPIAPIGLNFGLRMAECIAQCLNLQREFHDIASEHGVLGLEPLKQSLIH